MLNTGSAASGQKSNQARSVRVDASLRRLLMIFFGGLLLVIGMRVFFDNLQEELSLKSANERARLFIGEEIVRSIHGIEKDLYQMAVTSNPGGVRLLHDSIDRQADKLRHDLQVLSSGGTVRREVLLNIEGHDDMVSEAVFTPSASDQGYVMELIEISPLLVQIDDRVHELEHLLDARWRHVESNDRARFFQNEMEISVFLKHVPPYFKRLEENANRLFFDSSERLRRLEAELAVQRQRLVRAEQGLIALVVLFASIGALLVVRRIRLANDAREAALKDARAARDAAERASRTKSDFVSRMSHELRTPLNAIIGFAQLLESEPLDDSQRQYVSLINSSGNHLMELINAVLDHAKIEAGGLTLERISYDFPATIESVRSIVMERASSKGLDFIATIASDLPARLMGDPTRLRQVLINLLVNAVKFTEQGSVELRIAIDDGLLVFSIRDSGIGMDEEALGRLFQPFAQADETITRKYGGTGLGLMISKELVEAMGGAIEVESAPGVGTCFWIRLPLELADEPAPETSLPAQAVAAANLPELIGGRVLLVDDNRVNQQLASVMLGRLGLTFDLADHGRHALAQIASHPYKLVLMDMEMPEMDGLTATRELRKAEQAKGDGAHLVVIAMTANALAEHRERCYEAGMDGYISKPVSIQALRGEIVRLFHHSAPGTDPVEPEVSPKVNETGRPEVVFDRQRVMEMMGDEDLFRTLADMFISELPASLSEMEVAANAGQWPEVSRMAHTLKGLCGTFAATHAEHLARELEEAAGRGDEALARSLLPEVRQRLEDLSGALRT